MRRLPLLISVPHAGTRVPPEVEALCLLSPAQIEKDSDEGAGPIYHPLRKQVTALVTTPIARTVVDVNRSAGDRKPSGVIKSRTFEREKVWRSPLDETLVNRLIQRYYRPYHRALQHLAQKARLGVDCHVMSAYGPPTAADAGIERPRVCLGIADGTCPAKWADALTVFLGDAFESEVSINVPFRGGHITRSRPGDIPWVQLELSASAWLSTGEKNRRVREALEAFCVERFGARNG
jgi:N-formylglutamate deformylase